MIVVNCLPDIVNPLEWLDVQLFQMMEALHDELVLGEIAHPVLDQQALPILQELFEFAAHHVVIPSFLHDTTPDTEDVNGPACRADVSRLRFRRGSTVDRGCKGRLTVRQGVVMMVSGCTGQAFGRRYGRQNPPGVGG